MNQVVCVQVPLGTDKTHPEVLQPVGWHLERLGQELLSEGSVHLYFQQINARQSVPNRFQALERTQEELQNNLVYMETTYGRQYECLGLLNSGVVFQKKIVQTGGGQVQVIQQRVVTQEKSVLQTKQQIVKQHYHLLKARFQVFRQGDFLLRVLQVNRPSHVLMVNQMIYWPCLSSAAKTYETVRAQVFQSVENTLLSIYRQLLHCQASPFAQPLPLQETKELFGLSFESLAAWQEVELLVSILNSRP